MKLAPLFAGAVLGIVILSLSGCGRSAARAEEEYAKAAERAAIEEMRLETLEDQSAALEQTNGRDADFDAKQAEIKLQRERVAKAKAVMDEAEKHRAH